MGDRTAAVPPADAAGTAALPIAGDESRVFLNYTQAELDAAYDQAAWEPAIQRYRDRQATLSDRTRSRIGAPLRRAYGSGAIERLDIYRTAAPALAPVFVFIHGGAWRRGSAKNSAGPAEMFTRAGAHYVAPDFALVQEVGGSLVPIADQVCRAIAWVWRNAAEFGGDPERFYVGGHSSGAHLAAVALTADWQREFGLPADFIKAGLLSSGMYDLAPVALSQRSSYVAFTDDMIAALSPQRHLNRLHAPLIVACGTSESPEFQRQARDFAAAVREAGKPVELITAEHYGHFDLAETLGNPYGVLGAVALRLLGLASP